MNELGRVLIADDEETVLFSTAALLEDEGFSCDTVSDGQSALNSLNQNQYDVMIADWKMPGNTDLELLRSMPANAAGMPVIVITGYPKLGEAVQRLQAPLFAHLEKPFDFRDLLQLVLGAVEFRKRNIVKG